MENSNPVRVNHEEGATGKAVCPVPCIYQESFDGDHKDKGGERSPEWKPATIKHDTVLSANPKSDMARRRKMASNVTELKEENNTRKRKVFKMFKLIALF